MLKARSPITEETRKKLSKKSFGKNNPKARKVICIETGYIFGTRKDAAK
jgi:hypothetical protein